MKIEIIIPYFNGQDTIIRLIESVPKNIKITIVDDLSTKSLPNLFYPNVKIIRLNYKGYFSGGVNVGIQNTTENVLILNQDTYFTGDKWLSQLQELVEQDYHYIGESISGERLDWPNKYIHGTYMYISRECIDKVGLLNNDLYPMWGATAEYQLRVARENLKIKPLHKVDDFVHLRPSGESFGKSFQELLKTEKENKPTFILTPPLISVVIPIYNFSTWLESTVNSLVGGQTDLGFWKQQTFASFEVVIVDDGSTDNTPENIKKVCDSWKGVRSIRLNRPLNQVLENGKYIGKPYALNAGIKSAFGKYIVPLDADDMMEENRLQELFCCMQENPHSIIYDNVYMFGEGERKSVWTMNDYDFDKLVYKNHIHNSIMFEKSAWQEIGGYSTNFGKGRDDWSINVKFGLNGYCGIHADNVGLLYRREGQNRTIENTKPEWMEYFQKQMVKEFPELYKGKKPKNCCGKSRDKIGSRHTFREWF